MDTSGFKLTSAQSKVQRDGLCCKWRNSQFSIYLHEGLFSYEASQNFSQNYCFGNLGDLRRIFDYGKSRKGFVGASFEEIWQCGT